MRIRIKTNADPQSVLWNRERNCRKRNFCLSETGTGMHHGSGTGFGSGSHIKCQNKKVKKSKMKGQFSEK